ncbi:MAG: transcriptional repressor [Clostridiales bacterium]|nr:transcriptional repressor [Clostridiales bacterium]
MAIEITYKTKQKEYILSYLEQNREKHLTVDNMIDFLKQNDTPVGKSTVYRYLDVLVNKGIVRKYIVEEGKSSCYQYINDGHACKEHFHLKCNDCGKLFHVECERLEGINNHILEHHKFEIDNSKTVYYGTCEKCHKSNIK